MNILGVDVGGTKIDAGKLSGKKITNRYTYPTEAQKSKKEVIDRIIFTINQIFEPSIEAIGIGVPGLVDIENGIVHQVQNIPAWKKVHLKELIEAHFHVPVFVNNDANCFAIGEKIFGKGINFQNIVGITLGTGLGAGIIINNNIYSGKNCGAGEFGAISYLDKNYEYYCGSNFFNNIHQIDGHKVYKAALNGSEKELNILSELGTHIGNVIKTILFSVDPEIIIIGGSISKSFKFFKKAMWKTVKSFPNQIVLDKLKIEKSELNNAILGAAALCFDQVEVVKTQ